jgi:hypothetical protein
MISVVTVAKVPAGHDINFPHQADSSMSFLTLPAQTKESKQSKIIYLNDVTAL